MKKMSVFVLILFVFSISLYACSPAAPPAAAPEAPEAPEQQVEPAQPAEPAEPAEPAQQEPATQPQAAPITLEYWQVDFAGWDEGINKVISMFEAEYPNIKINYTPVSYDEINEKIAAMVPVGQGPDLVNPFYGWVPLWAKSGFLAPLSEDLFPEAEMSELFLPAINAQYYDGKLWGVPMNQSNWAILYNVDHFEEAGITKLPETFDELREAAIQCTVREDSGELTRAGYFVAFGTQEHILWKVLAQKNGQPLFSPDHKTVKWNDTPIGAEAFAWVANLVVEDKVNDVGFADGSVASAFYTGQTCMRLGSPGNLPVIRTNAPDLNFGSFPLPRGSAEDPAVANMNQTQYWSFNMTAKAASDPARAEAAETFLKFLTKPEVSLEYIKIVGGLPVHKSLIDDPFFKDDPQLAAFMATLPDSEPLFWVDEKAERQLVLDMADRVLLNNEDIKEVFDWGTRQQQMVRDEFFNY